MYINTRHVKIHAQKGWWGLLMNPRCEFDIELGPDKLGPTGPSTIRRWTRRSMCDAPTGRLAQVWRTLMMVHQARYVATHSDNTVEIEVLDPDLYRAIKYGRKFKNVQAKMKIMQAANGSPEYSQVRINDGGRHTDLDFQLERSYTGSRMSIDYWGNYSAMQAVSPWAFVDMFRAEFGPAMEDQKQQDAMFADLKREVIIRCMLVPVAEAGGGRPHTYYKTFARRIA